MINPSRLLGSFFGSSATQGLAGGLAGGLLTSRRGRHFGKQALKIGALAAIGALAYTAYQRFKRSSDDRPQGESRTPPTVALFNAPPQGSGFATSDTDAGAGDLGLTLVRTMIAAAKADGKLDGNETEAILGRVDELALSADEKALLIDELRAPVDVDALVAAAQTPEIATEIYVAALMAIELDTPAERAWLAQLASRLELDDALVETIHSELEIAQT